METLTEQVWRQVHVESDLPDWSDPDTLRVFVYGGGVVVPGILCDHFYRALSARYGVSVRGFEVDGTTPDLIPISTLLSELSAADHVLVVRGPVPHFEPFVVTGSSPPVMPATGRQDGFRIEFNIVKKPTAHL